MLHPLDDHPIHQTPEPLAHPATGDRNFYDRYFFNGYTRDGSLFFAAAFGVYRNRAIVDAAFSVVRAGRQHSVHASRQGDAHGGLVAAPIEIAIEEPMRTLGLRVAPNEWGLEAELRFRARSVAVEEPRFVHREEQRLVMDVTRITQFGVWEGSLRVAGETIAVEPRTVLGCRDRSWGIRPVGERAAGPMLSAPQFFWLWAPLQFDDCCTHFDVNEDASGRRWHQNGVVVPLLADPATSSPVDASGIRGTRDVEHRIEWQRGTRRAARAEIALVGHDGRRDAIALEPILTFQMLGIGYLHPEWGHGMWKGPAAAAGDSFAIADVNPLDPRFVHVQQLVRARWGERSGVGVLEQLVIGEHRPSGLSGLFDGAP
ncbi:MAG: hypothetical protein DCC71_23845 [Proteobacteria bacterium]|nr:MAG: hypothetical protein DCC71_23845 [Pseudomonadota bacterium]